MKDLPLPPACPTPAPAPADTTPRIITESTSVAFDTQAGTADVSINGQAYHLRMDSEDLGLNHHVVVTDSAGKRIHDPAVLERIAQALENTEDDLRTGMMAAPPATADAPTVNNPQNASAVRMLDLMGDDLRSQSGRSFPAVVNDALRDHDVVQNRPDGSFRPVPPDMNFGPRLRPGR